MSSVAVWLQRLVDGAAILALWLSGTGLVGMTLAVGWLVFGRYVLNDSPIWVEPVAIQLMAWFILLGAAVGVKEGRHLGFDVLRQIVPRPVARIMDVLGQIAVVAFGVGMVWYGAELVRGTWTARLPVLGWPGGMDYLPLVAGGALVALFGLANLARLLTPSRPPEARAWKP